MKPEPEFQLFEQDENGPYTRSRLLIAMMAYVDEPVLDYQAARLVKLIPIEGTAFYAVEL